ALLSAPPPTEVLPLSLHDALPISPCGHAAERGCAHGQGIGRAMAETAHDDVKSLSFEAALEQLEQIVQKLESGRAPLAESIAIYERGEALKAHCETLLRTAEARIEKITLSREGKAVGVEPLDAN